MDPQMDLYLNRICAQSSSPTYAECLTIHYQDNQIYLKGIHSYGFWKVLIKHYQYTKKYTPELLYNESKILCSLGVWGFLFGVPYRYCSISPNTCIRLTDSKLTGGVRRKKKVYEYMWKM